MHRPVGRRGVDGVHKRRKDRDWRCRVCRRGRRGIGGNLAVY
jgi:hypothetical protein